MHTESLLLARIELRYILYFVSTFLFYVARGCIIMLQMLLYSCTELSQLSGVAAILRFSPPESEDSQDSDSD